MMGDTAAAAPPEENVFLVGPPLPPPNIIGYRRMRRALRSWACGPCCGISLHGMHRTGKTSLAKELCWLLNNDTENKILCLYVNLAEVEKETGENWFCTVLRFIITEVLLDTLPERDIRLDDIPGLETSLQDFETAPPTSNRFRSRFKRIFTRLARAGWKTCLILDEFDRVADPDGFESKADFESFRTLSGQECGVGLMLISRRELYLLEKSNPSNSVFNGAFSKYSLPGFQESDGSDGSEPHHDMAEYYAVLARYGITLSEAEKDELWFFTGWNPYLLSVFGYEMADAVLNALPRPSMRQIYIRRQQTVRDYMDTVYSRLESDARLKNENSYAQKLVGIVIGPMIGITEGDIDLFTALGYLRRTGDADAPYQCISGSFTHYLSNKRISTNDAWKDLMDLDTVLRGTIRRELDSGPAPLTQEQWFAVLADAFLRADGQPNFRRDSYLRDINLNKDIYHEQLGVLDVMSLKDCFRILRAYWYENFSRYFDEDEQDLSKWKDIFTLCGEARNPFAHNTAKKLLTAEQQARVQSYCSDITMQIRQNMNKCTSAGLPAGLREKLAALGAQS